MIINTKELGDTTRGEVWDRFYQDFAFKPSTESWPSVASELPQLKFDLHTIWTKDVAKFEQKTAKLSALAQQLFIELVDEGETIYALDWQHACFEFDPRIDVSGWPVEVLPNGDYYIFLTKDMKNVWFGHPWEQSITIIGEKIAPLASDKLGSFNEIEITPFKSSRDTRR